MNESELVTAIAEHASVTKEGAQKMFSAITGSITDAVARDEAVTVDGLGTFQKRHRPETTNTVTFTAGKTLRASLH
ncbi:HU family DNA-binding protein [Kitasatospora purpeofusca]|uniref:HU family DNA-binding protein n=1 Tax=Kitasatospora purpeofusca TaxID=67352 RepID=UPI0035D76D01